MNGGREIVAQVREHLETFADAAALSSQGFYRCTCGAAIRRDQEWCLICAEDSPEDARGSLSVQRTRKL